MTQEPLDHLPLAGGGLDPVAEPDPGDPQHAANVLDVPLDLGREVLGGRHLPHVQCGPQGPGQSPGDPGDDEIERGGVLRPGELPAVLLAVELLDAAVDAEVDGLGEAFPDGPCFVPDRFRTSYGPRVILRSSRWQRA